MIVRKIIAASLALALLLRPSVLTAQEIHSACGLNIINSLKKDGDPNWNQTKEAVFDVIPPVAAGVAAEKHPPTAVAMIEVPFYDNEYRAVFGMDRDPTAAEDADIMAARKQYMKSAFNGMKNITGIDGPRDDAGFTNFLRQEKSNYVIFVGHNQNGEFRFRNGNALSLIIMSKRCGEIQKTCIFVSCRSKDYISDGSVGVKHDLKLDEGIWLGSRIATWIDSQKQPVSIDDIRAFFAKAEREAKLKYHTSYIVLAGCGGAAAAGSTYGVYILIEGTEN